jgi:hypothetical protein
MEKDIMPNDVPNNVPDDTPNVLTNDTPNDLPNDTNAVDIQALERQAEERGYLRGRNERIRELMARPSVWQDITMRADDDVDEAYSSVRNGVPTILQNLPRDIWEQ